MLGVTFYFDNGNLDVLLDSLARLPEHLRPHIFGHNEGVKDLKNTLSNGILFKRFLEKSKSGFFLYAEEAIYSLLTRKSETKLYVQGVSPPEALLLLRSLSRHGVPFAYAADSAEVQHRNRVVKKIKQGTYESWVGRDWHRYIPGLYWSTVLAEEIAAQHGVPLNVLEDAAKSVEGLAEGRRLLRFFDDPDEWLKNASRLDDLCAKTSGMFSLTRVMPAVERAASIPEIQSALNDWKQFHAKTNALIFAQTSARLEAEVDSDGSDIFIDMSIELEEDVPRIRDHMLLMIAVGYGMRLYVPAGHQRVLPMMIGLSGRNAGQSYVELKPRLRRRSAHAVSGGPMSEESGSAMEHTKLRSLGQP